MHKTTSSNRFPVSGHEEMETDENLDKKVDVTNLFSIDDWESCDDINDPGFPWDIPHLVDQFSTFYSE